MTVMFEYSEYRNGGTGFKKVTSNAKALTFYKKLEKRGQVSIKVVDERMTGYGRESSEWTYSCMVTLLPLSNIKT